MQGLTEEMELRELLDMNGEREVDANENLMSILNMIHFCTGMRVQLPMSILVFTICG